MFSACLKNLGILSIQILSFSLENTLMYVEIFISSFLSFFSKLNRSSNHPVWASCLLHVPTATPAFSSCPVFFPSILFPIISYLVPVLILKSWYSCLKYFCSCEILLAVFMLGFSNHSLGCCDLKERERGGSLAEPDIV